LYNHDHHHIGLNGFTPAEVYHGHYLQLAAEHQRVLDAAYADNPQRWINGAPRVPMPPAVVAINPAPPLEAESCSPIANEVVPAEFPAILPNPKEVLAT
jgi:putative transposase